MRRRRFFVAIAAIATSVLCSVGRAPADQPFYAGKTLTISTHGGIAGSYDILARLLAGYMGKHIPGDPSIIVINQEGAGGLTAYDYADKVAPQDGTFITLVSQGLLVLQALGEPGVDISLNKMHWLGNFSDWNTVTVTWRTSPVKTIEQATTRTVVVGSSGAGSDSSQIPIAYNHLLGTHFKPIYGYEGGAQMNVAMQRGELDGRGTNTWESYKNELPNDYKTLNVLVQLGLKKDPGLPNVPLLIDLLHGDPMKEKIARFLSLTLSINRPIAAPPGVSADKVQILRKAFDDTMKDPAFLNAAQKARLDISPMGGQEVAKDVRDVLSTSPDVVAATKAVLEMK